MAHTAPVACERASIRGGVRLVRLSHDRRCANPGTGQLRLTTQARQLSIPSHPRYYAIRTDVALVKAGWLLKKGRRTRRWKKRFFVLTDCRGLVFFKVKTKWSGKKSINVQGVYALSGAELVGRTRETKHGQWAFQLVTHSDASESAGPASQFKNCEMALPTRELAEEWRAAIADAAAAAAAGAVTVRATPEEYLALVSSEEKAEILARSGPQDEQRDCHDAVQVLSEGAASPAHRAEAEATPLLPSSSPAASAGARRRSLSLHLPASLKVLEQEAADSAGAGGTPLGRNARGAAPPCWRLLRVASGGARVFTPSDARRAEGVFASGSRGRSVLKVVSAVAEDPQRICAAYLDCTLRHTWDPSWAEGGVVDACGDDPMQVSACLKTTNCLPVTPHVNPSHNATPSP